MEKILVINAETSQIKEVYVSDICQVRAVKTKSGIKQLIELSDNQTYRFPTDREYVDMLISENNSFALSDRGVIVNKDQVAEVDEENWLVRFKNGTDARLSLVHSKNLI